jgi:hypothetical protein
VRKKSPETLLTRLAAWCLQDRWEEGAATRRQVEKRAMEFVHLIDLAFAAGQDELWLAQALLQSASTALSLCRQQADAVTLLAELVEVRLEQFARTVDPTSVPQPAFALAMCQSVFDLATCQDSSVQERAGTSLGLANAAEAAAAWMIVQWLAAATADPIYRHLQEFVQERLEEIQAANSSQLDGRLSAEEFLSTEMLRRVRLERPFRSTTLTVMGGGQS